MVVFWLMGLDFWDGTPFARASSFDRHSKGEGGF
jgi:hypothetical protein